MTNKKIPKLSIGNNSIKTTEMPNIFTDLYPIQDLKTTNRFFKLKNPFKNLLSTEEIKVINKFESNFKSKNLNLHTKEGFEKLLDFINEHSHKINFFLLSRESISSYLQIRTINFLFDYAFSKLENLSIEITSDNSNLKIPDYLHLLSETIDNVLIESGYQIMPISICFLMLKLDPLDKFEARYSCCNFLLVQKNTNLVTEILEAFPEDKSSHFLYTKFFNECFIDNTNTEKINNLLSAAIYQNDNYFSSYQLETKKRNDDFFDIKNDLVLESFDYFNIHYGDMLWDTYQGLVKFIQSTSENISKQTTLKELSSSLKMLRKIEESSLEELYQLSNLINERITELNDELIYKKKLTLRKGMKVNFFNPNTKCIEQGMISKINIKTVILTQKGKQFKVDIPLLKDLV